MIGCRDILEAATTMRCSRPSDDGTEITMPAVLKNWSGVYTYGATTMLHPTTLDEMRRIVATVPKVHAVGSRHCFNGIADSAELIRLDRMPMAVDIRPRGWYRDGERRYALRRIGDRARAGRSGAAQHGIAAAYHGRWRRYLGDARMGDRLRNLAGAVAGIELVTSDGDVLRVARGDADFEGMVVHIGALGGITRLTLDIEPTFRMRQEVFLDLAWDVLYEQFDEIMSSGDSVSLFTDYGDTVNELWVKTRVPEDDSWKSRTELFGARAATVQTHPVARFDGLVCTDQMGVPGPWCDRLPHFKVEAIGDAGSEMQAEYMVDRKDAVAGIRALKEISEVVRPYILGRIPQRCAGRSLDELGIPA